MGGLLPPQNLQHITPSRFQAIPGTVAALLLYSFFRRLLSLLLDRFFRHDLALLSQNFRLSWQFSGYYGQTMLPNL